MKRSTLIYLLLGFVGFGVLFILYKELTKEPSAKLTCCDEIATELQEAHVDASQTWADYGLMCTLV